MPSLTCAYVCALSLAVLAAVALSLFLATTTVIEQGIDITNAIRDRNAEPEPEPVSPRPPPVLLARGSGQTQENEPRCRRGNLVRSFVGGA